jgi:hypothetical protein
VATDVKTAVLEIHTVCSADVIPIRDATVGPACPKFKPNTVVAKPIPTPCGRFAVGLSLEAKTRNAAESKENASVRVAVASWLAIVR